MFIQKVFHVRHSLEDTRTALKKVHLYRRQLDGIRKAIITEDGSSQFDCEMPNGFRAHCVVTELPTEDPNQALFQSTAGNLQISGLIEFVPVRENLTEVQLTLEYSFQSAVHTLVDKVTRGTERFINRQLQRLEGWLDGASISGSDPAGGHFAAHLPQFAQ